MPYEELLAALNPLQGRTDVTTAQVLEAVLLAYNQATGEGLAAATLDEEASARLRLYLVEAEINGTGSTLFHQSRILDHLPLYPDTASKLNVMLQRRCTVCPDGNEFPPSTFPIGVPPWSHQCAGQVGRALRQAIDHSPHYTEHFSARTAHGAVCMRIVFVLGNAATMKDCDNMAKGLLDAFQGLLYENDKQVEHLDLIKIHHHPGAGSGYNPRPGRLHDDQQHRRCSGAQARRSPMDAGSRCEKVPADADLVPDDSSMPAGRQVSNSLNAFSLGTRVKLSFANGMGPGGPKYPRASSTFRMVDNGASPWPGCLVRTRPH
jgi:hypothetical protein